MEETKKAVELTLNELGNLIPRMPDPQEMSNAQKDKEKKLLYCRLKALNATPRSDWHRGFEDVLQIDVESWDNDAHILREVTIGEDPPRADFIVVVIYDLPGSVKAIFRFFRKQNLIEYKGPDEIITERMILKTASYGGYLIGTTKDAQYKMEDVTLTLFGAKKSKAVFERLERDGMLFRTETKGIYRVEKFTPLPYQIVITSELEGDEYAAYRALSNHAKAKDVGKLLEALKSESGETRDRYHRILDLIEKKNPGAVAEMIREENSVKDGSGRPPPKKRRNNKALQNQNFFRATDCNGTD